MHDANFACYNHTSAKKYCGEGKMKTKESTLELERIIRRIFDYAYTNSSIRVPAVTCKEVGKILHVGMYLEEVENTRPGFSEIHTAQENDSQKPNNAASTIREKFSEMNSHWDIYDDEIRFSDTDILYICNALSPVYISDPKRDVFGDALEIFRSKWAKQEGGQFFTDQRVTSLAIELLNFDPIAGDDLVDICAGTGGFLMAGLNRIRDLVEKHQGEENQILKLASSSLKGLEVDEEIRELGNSTLGARLGKYQDQLIGGANSLINNQVEKNERVKFDSHLCAATNPPFGAKISISDQEVLQTYELAKTSNTQVRNKRYKASTIYKRSPDILFIEQNIRLLKPGKGRVAIVIPYQILSGPQTLFVRDWIIRNCHIEVVVDLPSETFQPHTGTKTALVLLRRRESPLLDAATAENEEIFMATPRWIGHDRRGNPVYSVDPDGKSTTDILSDFPQVESAYLAWRNGNCPNEVYEVCFVTHLKDVLADDHFRINALYHKPELQTNGVLNGELDDSKWTTVKVKDVTKRIFYPGRFKRSYVDYYPDAIPFFGGANILQMIVATEKWLRHDDPRLKNLAVQSGWILITRSGTTGIVSSVPDAWDGFAMSEHVIRIEPDEEKLDPAYLLVYLKTAQCQKQLARGVFGSVIDEITPETVGEIEVPIPKDGSLFLNLTKKAKSADMAKQKSLAELYGAVDDLSSKLPN